MLSRRALVAAALAAAALPALTACGGGQTQAATGASSAPPLAAASAPAASGGGTVQIAETGSSLLYPLFNLWQPDYQKAHPNVQISTASTGSGTGISDAIKGLVQIGASDAYMADAQVQQNPGLLNIPLVISAQQINYNLPGLNSQHLHLDGAVLAGIYTGKISSWDDAQIKALNPGVALPHQAIVPVRRSDGSGDTFLFTTYLTDAAPSIWTQGFNTTVNWPAVSAEVAANGNQGVEQAIKQTPGAIGYVGISWLDAATKAGLGYAALQNRSGQFVLPTADTITAAASAMAGNTPKDERVSLIYAAGASSYPIINFEYAIVNAKQPSPAVASALQAFLTWALDPSGGSAAAYLNQVHFTPLPAAVVALSKAQIAEISG